MSPEKRLKRSARKLLALEILIYAAILASLSFIFFF